MSRSTLRLTGVAVAAVGAMAVGGTALAAPGGSTGPSSSDAPYLVRHVPGVTLTSLLTSGDSVGGYRMAGTPDGLGAYDNGDGTFTVLMNHEFGAGVERPAVAREHLRRVRVALGGGLDDPEGAVRARPDHEPGHHGLAQPRPALLGRPGPGQRLVQHGQSAWATTAGCSPTARSRPRTGAPSRTSSTPGSATS